MHRDLWIYKVIGTRLISQTVQEAFETLPIEQIMLGVITQNHSAIKAYENLGFKEFAVYKNYLKLADKYLDQRMMVKYREG